MIQTLKTAQRKKNIRIFTSLIATLEKSFGSEREIEIEPSCDVISKSDCNKDHCFEFFRMRPNSDDISAESHDDSSDLINNPETDKEISTALNVECK